MEELMTGDVNYLDHGGTVLFNGEFWILEPLHEPEPPEVGDEPLEGRIATARVAVGDVSLDNYTDSELISMANTCDMRDGEGHRYRDRTSMDRAILISDYARYYGLENIGSVEIYDKSELEHIFSGGER